jgi:hypothetical protein
MLHADHHPPGADVGDLDPDRLGGAEPRGYARGRLTVDAPTAGIENPARHVAGLTV